ncbi:MAG: GDP-mannose 4,6-dehydratase [Candidatus Dormiibacterota bacterium]
MPPPARRALITGITGQDGPYLAEQLLDEGWEVHGMVRAEEPVIAEVPAAVAIHQGSLTDQSSLESLLRASRPHHVYNLAAATSVAGSFEDPLATCDVTGVGVLRLLQAVRRVDPAIRLLQASSAEIFAGAAASPQNESTPLSPVSPYGVAKAFAHQMVQVYRRSFRLFAATAILYNHESPRRGLNFVSRKVTDGAARIALGLARELRLGTLEVERDWGYAPDYVRAMRLVLRQDAPDDYVVATGQTHTLLELLDIAFTAVSLDWREHVVSDPGLLRPAEPIRLCGDASRARDRLGWAPTVDFSDMIREMLASDLARLNPAAASAPPARAEAPR